MISRVPNMQTWTLFRLQYEHIFNEFQITNWVKNISFWQKHSIFIMNAFLLSNFFRSFFPRKIILSFLHKKLFYVVFDLRGSYVQRNIFLFLYYVSMPHCAMKRKTSWLWVEFFMHKLFSWKKLAHINRCRLIWNCNSKAL